MVILLCYILCIILTLFGFKKKENCAPNFPFNTQTV